MQSPPFPRYLVPPRSKYSPQHHILKHPQLPFLPQCGRSGQLRKISSPPGFDPRTVQPVAGRYTDHAARPTNISGASQEILCRVWSPELR